MNARVGRFARAPRSGVVLIVVSWLALASAAPARAQGAALRRPALHWVRGPGASGCVDPRLLAQRVEELVGPVLVRAPEAEHSIEGYVEARSAREPDHEARTAREPDHEARTAREPHREPRLAREPQSEAGAREPHHEAHGAGRQGGAGPVREPGGGRPNLRVSVRVVSASGQVLGERVLEQATTPCSALTPAIAFVIAMMIDPGVAAHGLPSELVALLGEEGDAPEEKLLDELEQAPPVPAVHPPHAPVALRPEPARRAEPRFQAATLVRAAYREAPRTLLSGEVRLLYALRAPLALAGYLRAGAQAGAHDVRTAASVRVSAYDLGVAACAGQSAGPIVRLHGCVGIELTGASAKGHGFHDDERTFLMTAGLVGQVTVRVRIHGAWGLVAALSGRYLANTRHFEAVRSDGTHALLFRLPSTTIGIALGPSYEF